MTTSATILQEMATKYKVGPISELLELVDKDITEEDGILVGDRRYYSMGHKTHNVLNDLGLSEGSDFKSFITRNTTNYPTLVGYKKAIKSAITRRSKVTIGKQLNGDPIVYNFAKLKV